jgi:AmmeMemoRadiSam system protein A
MTPPATGWPAFARDVIERIVRGSDVLRAQPGPLCGDGTSPHGGAFVTLHRFTRLRGCMGALDGSLSLTEAVRQAAVSAALHDPRFSPLSSAELRELRISVSVLSPPRPWAGIAELSLGMHGIVVSRDGRRGLFLPEVAHNHNLTHEEFLSRCCEDKAGLSPDAWRDPATEVLVFTTRVETE